MNPDTPCKCGAKPQYMSCEMCFLGLCKVCELNCDSQWYPTKEDEEVDIFLCRKCAKKYNKKTKPALDDVVRPTTVGSSIHPSTQTTT